MAFNMKNRHLLSLVHHTEREIKYLLDLSRDLKRAKYAGTEQQTLKGKNIALIFEKTSTRTRCAFEVAAYDQGAQVTYIDPNSSQIGHKESMKDTARVLGRMYDGIEYRGFKQSIVQELADYAGVAAHDAGFAVCGVAPAIFCRHGAGTNRRHPVESAPRAHRADCGGHGVGVDAER